MVSDQGHSDQETGDSEELLRQWEARIAGSRDPVEALADLLGSRRAGRHHLYGLSGTEVLGCELGRILGAGGMGVTYAGVTKQGDAVAVKLVPQVVGTSRERFEQECRVLRELQHRAIVRYRAHAVTDEEIGVLVMDLVVGLDLEQLLVELHRECPTEQLHPVAQEMLREVSTDGARRMQSPRMWRRVMRMLSDVADGLHAAHEQGVVHRDVKPANILVGADLAPILIDFGLARDALNRASFTQSGAAMGTLAYMAPEQLGRDPGAVDRRADVYALGLVLYRAFCGVDLRELVGEVVSSRSRPFLLTSSQCDSLPPSAQAILYRCLDPIPDRRYQTAAALADDLRAAAGHGTLSARVPSPLSRFCRDRRRVASAVAVALAVCLLVVWWQWPRGRDVLFLANHDDAEIVLEDGRRVRLGNRHWLPYGQHRVQMRGPNLHWDTKHVSVVPGMGVQPVHFLTYDESQALPAFRQPGQPAIQLMSGHGRDPVGPGLKVDEVSIDGRVRDNGSSPWWQTFEVKPGEHVFRAVDGLGRVEQQSLVLDSGPVDIQLLPGVMADVDGDYRRTWSSVLSPRADDLELHGNYSKWMGGARESGLGGLGAKQAECALTAPVAGQTVTVDLVCRFPSPMRSAVVYLRNVVGPYGELQIHAGFDGSVLQPWRRGADGQFEARQAFRIAEGSATLRVRATMRVASDPGLASVDQRFLDGSVFGGHWTDEPPCFAIVADPGDQARLPVSSRPTLEDLEDFGEVVDHGLVTSAALQNISVVAMLPGPNLAMDLLISMNDGANSCVVQRWSWPGLVYKASLLPEQMHARKQGLADGDAFGGNLAVIAGLRPDGWSDVVVGDHSSAIRGAAAGGGLARMSWPQGKPLWMWPSASMESFAPLGDDQYGARVASCGDWDGDGVADIVSSAVGFWASPDDPQVGKVEVLSAVDGALLWRQVGGRRRGESCAYDVWTFDRLKPACLLLRSANRPDGVDAALEKYWSVRGGGRDGVETSSVASPAMSTATLVGSDGADEAALLLLVSGQSQAMGTGLRRYVVRDRELILEAEQALDLPKLQPNQQGRLKAVRVGDLDDDGVRDAAFVFAGEAYRTGVLFVSGSSLRLLGFAELPFEPTGAGVWAPARSGAPAQLLLPAGSRLLGVIPK
ncbi:MAG: tRNA A-37 threonylcarbamoyl transferase component Bud32 [Neolewinella sp.]|jgi:tRNA A-37 threonylcarbamoyl transferase component Bud32